MGINFNSGSNVWVKTRNDAVSDGKDGASDLNSANMASFSDDIGWTAQTAATTDTGTFSLIQLFKRFLSVKLPIGANTTANALCAALPSDDVIRTNTANISTKSDAIATSTAGADTKLGTVNTNLGTISTNIASSNTLLTTIETNIDTTNTSLAALVPKPIVDVNYAWTRPNDTSGYVANDVMTNSTPSVPFWDNLVAANGDTGYIHKIVLTCSHNTSYDVKLALFKTTVTTSADSAQCTLTDADIAANNMIGVFTLATLAIMTPGAGAAGNSQSTYIPTHPIPFTTSGSKGLFGQFIATAPATPVALAEFNCTLTVSRV
jgi:hypothetical protein